MTYDIQLYFSNGTSLKFMGSKTYNVNNGVISFTDAANVEHISNMPFVLIKRPVR